MERQTKAMFVSPLRTVDKSVSIKNETPQSISLTLYLKLSTWSKITKLQHEMSANL